MNRTYQDLLLAVLKAYGISEGKTTPKVIGIKHPAISMFLPEILAAFPKAHVLHIVRDYRDVLHSLLQLPFETQNIFTMSHRWLSYNRSYQRVAEKEPEKCTLLRYEDLVHDPANALRPFLEKHELKWQNEMLNVAQYLMQKQADHAILEKYQKHLTQPVTNQLIGKGKLALTKKQLRVAESICGTFGQHHYGYEMTKKPFQINWLASFVVKFWASLYFKVEKFSNKLPPSLKLQYLNLKNLSAARWHRDLINKSQ